MGKILLGIYGASTQIAAFIFLIQMIEEDKWWQILFIDPIISELKGLVWPLFVL
ncbi:MAG: hypothetical protein IJ759_00525 [Bacteroidales bacterium]|nr:hypothetical protein [Bacteroidales bacterium]